MSLFDPGSCPPKLFAGKPTITSELPYFLYNSSSSAYCGVFPHCEAVLTIRIFLPLYLEKSIVPPSSEGTLKSYMDDTIAIIIPEKGVGSLNEDAILTSAGALEKIAVCRVTSLMKAIDELHLNGIKVFASEMTATKKIYDLNFAEPCAIVLGGEEHGIYPAVMKICDEQFQIPMTGDFESLNVSVANGIILYEAMKQRLVL